MVQACKRRHNLLQKTGQKREALLSLPSADHKSCNENDHKDHTSGDGDQQDSGVGSIANDPGRHWNNNYMGSHGGAVLRGGTCWLIQHPH